ncbi:alpha/beta fold hydrolase [Amycolatopsis tolypomycina]|uniref:alpha/beta fold hydrolase n=1 Tax=Amycolatopsis tolypomycina TaxID=208445 RepID=UPI0033ACAD39
MPPSTTSGRIRALSAGTERPGRPPVVLLPDLGAPGYLADTLHGCAAAFLADVVHESPSAVPGTVPHYLRAGPRRLLRMIRSAQRDAPERAMPLPTCPVLVMRGRRDTLSPEPWARSLAAAAGGEFVTVPGAPTFPARSGGATSASISEFAGG